MNVDDLRKGLKFAALNSALTALGCAIAAIVVWVVISTVARKKT